MLAQAAFMSLWEGREIPVTGSLKSETNYDILCYSSSLERGSLLLYVYIHNYWRLQDCM